MPRPPVIFDATNAPNPVPQAGDDPAWDKLTAALAAAPESPLTKDRVNLLTGPLNRSRGFAHWWADRVQQRHTAGQPIDIWLRMPPRDRASQVQVDLEGLDLREPDITRRFLNTGAAPVPGSPFEAALLESVLDGGCPDLPEPRSLPAMVAVAFEAANMIAVSKNSFDAGGKSRPVELRQKALKGLRQQHRTLAAAAKERRFAAGESDSTFPWSRTATALYNVAGPCWLASQIAIIGAASPFNTGVNKQPDTPAFGPGSHPAALLNQARENAASTAWWREKASQLATLEPTPDHDTDRYLGEWTAAAWCIAEPPALEEIFEEWSTAFIRLSGFRTAAVTHLLDMCARNRWLNPLDPSITSTDPAITRLLRTRQHNADTPAAKPRRTPSPVTKTSAGAAKAPARTTIAERTDLRIPAAVPENLVPEPLLAVARHRKWFKVDRGGQYR